MAGGAGGVRAGKAFVEVFADNSALVKGLNGAQARLKSFGAGVASIGASLSAASAAILGPVTASLKLFSSVGDGIAKAAKRTGTSTEFISEMGFAASQSGTSVEALEKSMRKMSQGIVDAERGTGEAKDALNELGVSAGELVSLSPEQQFSVIADRLAQIENPTKKAALAMDLFGRSGSELIPLLAGGAAGIDALREKARSLGLTMDAETAAKAEVLTDAMDQLWRTVKMAAINIGAALAPAVTELAKTATSAAVAVGAWIKKNSDLIVTVTKVAVVVGAFGAALVALGGTFIATGAAIKTLVVAFQTIRTAVIAANVAFAFLAANPVVAALTAVAAVAGIVGYALYSTSQRTAQLSDEMTRLREAGDAQRQQDLARLARLDALAQRENRNAQEMSEARAIIDSLGDRYGELGVATDDLADAHDRLADAMRRVAFEQISAEIEEQKKNFSELTNEIGNTVNRIKFNPFTSDKNRVNEAKTLESRRDAVVDQIESLQRRASALSRGDVGALTGVDVAPAAAGGGAAVGSGASDDAARRVHQLRLSMIADEQQRAIALLDERYDHELAKAREAGAYSDTLANIEEARALELSKLQADFARRTARAELDGAYEVANARLALVEDEHVRAMAAIELRYERAVELARLEGDATAEAHAAAVRDIERQVELARENVQLEQQVADIASANRSRGETIEELELRAKYEGVELERELLKLQRQRAIEAARAAGENLELVEREFDLRERLAALRDGASIERAAARFTFNPFEAKGLFPDEQRRDLRRAAEGIEALVRGMPGHGDRVARFLGPAAWRPAV